MKLRLINAGHQAITYFGLLLDFELVHLVTQDDRIDKFLMAYLDREATSTLKPLPGTDVTAYKAITIERFQVMLLCQKPLLSQHVVQFEPIS